MKYWKKTLLVWLVNFPCEVVQPMENSLPLLYLGQEKELQDPDADKGRTEVQQYVY